MVNSGKHIKKCFPQLLKSQILFLSKEGLRALVFPEALKIFLFRNFLADSLSMTIDGPSGILFPL